MRLFLLIAFLMVTGVGIAQPFFPNTVPVTASRFNHLSAGLLPQADSNTIVRKKWNLQSYQRIAVGMMFWKGGGASYLSAPIGLQLTRSLSRNLFAFADVSIAPTLVNFRQSFMNTPFKNGGMPGTGSAFQLGGYSRAALGIGYVNDERTFSITGSIGIERGTYPFAPGFSPINRAGFQNRYMQ